MKAKLLRVIIATTLLLLGGCKTQHEFKGNIDFMGIDELRKELKRTQQDRDHWKGLVQSGYGTTGVIELKPLNPIEVVFSGRGNWIVNASLNKINIAEREELKGSDGTLTNVNDFTKHLQETRIIRHYSQPIGTIIDTKKLMDYVNSKIQEERNHSFIKPIPLQESLGLVTGKSAKQTLAIEMIPTTPDPKNDWMIKVELRILNANGKTYRTLQSKTFSRSVMPEHTLGQPIITELQFEVASIN